MSENKSKRNLKLAEDTNTSAPGSTVADGSQSLTQRPPKRARHFPDALGISRPSSPVPRRAHARSTSPLPRASEDDLSMVPPASDGSQEVRSDLNDQGDAPGLGIAEDTACCVPAPDPSVTSSMKQVVSEGHFFKDSKNFEIKDMQINSAGRDVNIKTNTNVTTNYYETHDRSLSKIPYAEGAGINTTKACLDGTRTDILAKIECRITDITTPRVLWISGPAGTGKSAIAHTIARRWIYDMMGIGSCFCFNRQVVNRHEKLFSTIACDLAGRIPGLKDYLIKLVTTEPALATTPDVTQQWHRLIEAPITSLVKDITGPVVIVIDALDEAGDAPSHRHILSILKNNVANLPSNFCILVTSRPLGDITEAFSGASGIQYESMDQISRSSTEHDIQFYISHQLQDIYISHDFDGQMLTQLTQKMGYLNGLALLVSILGIQVIS